MEGKRKQKRKVGKVILLGMSFLLTIVLTFTITLAWFYDSDWASNYVTMAGTVGIEIREVSSPIATSGAGQLHFNITTAKAYPGQAVDVSASVYNNGGRSVATGTSEGSPAFIRAHFAVFTNAGVDDPATPDIDEGELEKSINATALYEFLNSLVTAQNARDEGYYWVYYQNSGSKPMSLSGTSTEDIKHYFEGTQYDTPQSQGDKGYFYLCESDLEKLKPMAVGSAAVFLWNDTFIIPWTLSNYSADKMIFVAITFQAVQTFIPKIDGFGVIDNTPDNQLPLAQCKYNNSSVQTVFNSCNFTPIDTNINVDGDIIDFGSGEYISISAPTP